ncbi:hypothetical protein BC939DRAFT_481454 [Gamsiella multidivaricata]|uniref:uncharacterized protein n=1 Tax=Gamsiella multidivaricata TaxID=101098 RepID=UPI00221FE7E2|nr:uncharacterized protein BC939DRAFT_481454 [Gamsiella multidivaricata]KAI7817078.1 hypothetical protein BC939DRAFT_481454 [Gamsiella multidivaricata]
MSSVDLPSIQTNLAPYSTSCTSPSLAPAHPYHSVSPGSAFPSMSFQSRSYSISSSSSFLSACSSASDRSLSASPGPATPCDMMGRSPSFSHDSIYSKPILPSLQHKHHHLSSCPSPSFSASQRYNSSSLISSSSSRHHPYQLLCPQQPKQDYPHGYQERPRSPQYHSSIHSPLRPLSSPSSPSDMLPIHSPRSHGDYHSSYYHQQPHHRQSFYRSSNTHQVDYFQPRLATNTTLNPSFGYHTGIPMMTPKEEECEPSRSAFDHRAMSPAEDDRSDFALSMSGSPPMSQAGSSFSRESSPSVDSDRFGSMSEASASMTSLVSSSSSSSLSTTPAPTTTQLLLCPVCSRAFKPSKNQNCNLRRHLKNVHNMSPAIHPRKCKWDSLPDGRVKDDKDRKDRTRKSKRLWARKFRLRRKVEEAAVVLSMLSQAV